MRNDVKCTLVTNKQKQAQTHNFVYTRLQKNIIPSIYTELQTLEVQFGLKRTAFLSGTSNFVGPSYFETALVSDVINHTFLHKS